MKKLLLIATLALSLGGCAGLQSFYNVTTSAVNGASPTAIYVARNSFDAVEVTATNYIVYCKVHPSTPGCSKTAIAKLIPAVRSGRIARTNLVQWQKQNPPGTWGPIGMYNTLTTATATLQQISAQYNISGVAK